MRIISKKQSVQNFILAMCLLFTHNSTLYINVQVGMGDPYSYC